MKILLINNFHYKNGGASAVYLNTAKLLEKNGHDVIFFSINTENNINSAYQSFFIDKKTDINSSFFNKVRNIKNYFYNNQSVERLELLLKEEKPDIAHLHLYIGGLTSSILPVLKKYNVPAIYTAHDYRLVCPAYNFISASGKICEKCQGKSFYYCAINRCAKNNIVESTVMSIEMYYRNKFFNPSEYFSGFIFVSSFSREKHFQYFPLLKEKLNTVLYNFTTSNNSKTVKEDYFLYFGRLSEEKGLKTLISAFSKTTDCKLKIAGEGPEMDNVMSMISENKANNIECLGYVQGNELLDLVSKAYFVIVPSECYENNPMTIVEAYTYGTPVIGANIGGIPEIIIDGKTGFLFETGNPDSLIAKILEAKNLLKEKYNEMCLDSFNFAFRNFNESKYYERLIEFYKEIVSNYKKNI